MLLLANTDTEKAVFGEFGYFLGKWVYLMDAADDYEKDLKQGSFNPFVHTLKDKQLSQQEQNEYINKTINVTASRAISAFNLMEINTFIGIADNLVNLGLGDMQKKIIFDKHKKAIRKRQKLYE